MTAESGTKGNIRFAVIGAGHIGKRHMKIISANPGAELVAVCDRNTADSLDLDLGSVPFYQDLDRMLSEVDFDILCVATPNGLHSEQALKALKADKHVLIEKPMALTKADCEKVIFTALEKSKKVFCVMQNRYSPPSVWLKDIIEKGLLGNIHMVQANCFWNRDDRYYSHDNWKGVLKKDGGTLFTQFSHFVDMIYWLFGDITNIKTNFNDFTHKHSTDFEDSGFVSFDFVNGGMGSINYSTSVWDENFESSLTIIAEKGTVKISGQYMNEVEFCNIENYEMPELPPTNPANDYGIYKGSAANHEFVFDNVLNTINGNTSITTNALEGMKVVEIIERIYSQNSFIKK
jgi:UDP-N-acetyl-2-amino-2-deoxyglucuronate dehydrogenase